ncbi:MAG: Cupin domain protein, partial [Phycisphaerales bacterium]|nr:Cupin domain protein [Phycisphaerales bacterium]
MSDRYAIAQLDEIPPVPCPCGQARRAFHEAGGGLATMHLTDIWADARTHYHRRMTEI